MIKQLQLGFMILGIALLFSNPTWAIASNAQSLDHIIVVVNDTVITQSELDQAMATAKKEMSNTNIPPPAPDILRKQILEQLINRKLQLQMAEQIGIHTTDTEVDQAINHIAQGNNLSAAQLYEKVAGQGLTRAEYRQEIRDEITIQRLQQHEVAPKVTMTPADIQAFMRTNIQKTAAPAATEYHVEDILLPLSENATETTITLAKKQADRIVTKLRQGTPYSDVTIINNTMENNDLGWRKLAEIPSAFVNTLAQMKSGEITDPIQAANGLHILRLLGKRNATNGENSAMPTEKQAQQLVYERKFEEALQKWLRKLRAQAIINMHPENE
ncbi:MAG: hypothetical protein ACD_45C00151G0005 [uncultured bacterium]|nr:MAG: hypothetical protein ACD_45C00151G0005 [uncultured bacterium]